MNKNFVHLDQYITKVPMERQSVFLEIFNSIDAHLPKGFELGTASGMLQWQVPLADYPAGYHCTPNTPLPFIALASQKNSINLYHMGLYADPTLYDWFYEEYTKLSKKKVDMGKSCIRFKYFDEIPLELLSELAKKINPKQWIETYENTFKKKK